MLKVKVGIVASTVAMSLVGALVPGAAMAVPDPSGAAPGHSTAVAPDAVMVDSQLAVRADGLRAGMSAEQVAGTLFPDDAAARQHYVEQVKQVATTARRPDSAQAVPAVLAVFIPLLGRCVWGALSGGAVNEIITLVHQGRTATAESRIYAVVGGCISAVIPSPLQWLANQAKYAIVKAVLWVLVQLGPR